jgi:drug/metabolite transporter (DMT)-like permease
LKLQQIGLVLLAGVSLGSSVVLVRVGLGEVPPMVFIILRYVVTTLAFMITFLAMRRSFPTSRRVWTDILIAAVLNTAAPIILFTYALEYISSGVFGILLSLYPLMTAIGAHLLLEHEKLNALRIVGMIIALAGAVLLVLTGTTGLVGQSDLRGHLMVIIGVVLGAAGVIFVRARLTEQDGLVVTAGQIAFTLPMVLPFALAGPTLHLATITPLGWFAVAFSGIIGSYLGYFLLFVLIQRYGATSGALPGYVMPVVSTLLGALLLGEVVDGPLLGSAALVLMGVFLVSV